MRMRLPFGLIVLGFFTLIGCGAHKEKPEALAGKPEAGVVDDEGERPTSVDARSLSPVDQPTAPQPLPFQWPEASKNAAEPATKVKVPIRGTVHDADGHPAVGSTVVATSADTILAKATADASGNFSLGD